MSYKRYSEYKDSGIEWIGEIPKEWEIIVLKRIFLNRYGGSWGDDAKKNENDRICIRVADFDYPKMTIKHNVEYTVRNYSKDVIDKLTLKKNDILIEKSGGGDQTPVGRTIIFDEDFNALYANFLDRLRVKKYYIPKLIQYVLVSFYQNGITYKYVKQTTGIQNLDLSSLLAKEYVALPRINDQQSIASYLDTQCALIDKAIETQNKIIEKLKEYKKSIITEAVTKGLDKNAKMKDSGIEWIGKIPEGWGVRKLKKIVSLIADIDHYMPVTVDNGYPYLMTGDLKEHASKINFNICKHISSIDFKDLSRKIHPLLDDIIFARYATIGTVCYVDISSDFLVSYSCLTIRPNHSELLGKFLYYYFMSQTFFNEIGQYINSNTQSNVGLDSLQRIKVVLPDKNIQLKIIMFLDKKCEEIEKTILNKEQIIEKLQNFKKSLIYECVTGKRRV